MNFRYMPLILASLLLGTLAFWAIAAEPKGSALTADDKKHLDGLMKEFLFDPTGGERVRVNIVVRTVWGEEGKREVAGWFVPGKEGKPGRVYFTDGDSIPVPPEKEMKKVDFVAACQARYTVAARKDDGKKDDLEHDEVFQKMRQTAIGVIGDDDLALAAWLYRFGHDGLAARALAASRKVEGDPRKRLRGELAWSAFAGMVHAYMVRADEEALAHGERLLRLYGEETKQREYHQAAQVVEELKRRQKKGSFAKAPPEKPDGFDKWDAMKKVAYLINALEEVDARQDGQPGGVDLASDYRIQELIRLGDAAVPDLIDALEKDERLTRSVHFWRDFARSRTVLSVREAELTALMSILRVRVFEPRSTGDNFTARGEEGAKEMAKRLRRYWKEYGRLPFDERMMKVLTDPKTTFEAKREAAENLATINEEKHLQTTMQPTIIGGEPPRKPNPVVAKFSKPTVAEAILAAMDADLKDHDAKPAGGLSDYDRRHIEDHYLFNLVELDDKQVAAEAARRSQAADTGRMRRKWAYAAHWLGDPQPLKSFADDFRAGKVLLPANDRPQTNDDDQPGNVELRGIISFLASTATPEADRALYALADPKHPSYRMAANRVLKERGEWRDSATWFAHPYCLAILRRELDNTQPTGAAYKIEENRLVHRRGDGYSSGGIPEYLADPAARHNEAVERTCDVAAEKLNGLVVGLPLYHPLFKDADKRLAALKAGLDRFGATIAGRPGAKAGHSTYRPGLPFICPASCHWIAPPPPRT